MGVVASKNQVCLVNSDAVVFNLNDTRVQKGFSLTNPNLIRVVRRCGWSGSQVETDVCVKLKVPVQPMLRRRPRQAAAGPGAKSSVSQNCCALLATLHSSVNCSPFQLFTRSAVYSEQSNVPTGPGAKSSVSQLPKQVFSEHCSQPTVYTIICTHTTVNCTPCCHLFTVYCSQ